ncbi:MAG: S1-like domain-containing RNA-binding protein [Clostridiales bacterium]|nr:S1-like domain-containing RNA-binding protein [Clostridiales bacterium]
MFKLGEYQDLYYVKKVDFGVYLAEMPEDERHVLLPAKQVPPEAEIGGKIRVFLYKDSSDRMIATTNAPKIAIGEVAPLTVREVGQIGAFLDWGLEKDLFLPFKEMTARVSDGDSVLARIYVDKSSRLCASMKGLYELLRTDSTYQKDDVVKGRVYEFSDNFGTFVAVDDKYSARIANSEDHRNLAVGDVITARVTDVKPDGKLDLTLRERAYAQMEPDAEKILSLIDSYGGVLPFTEKATPEVIMRETGLSKAAFKRAVGRLYKDRKITIEGGKIRRG